MVVDEKLVERSGTILMKAFTTKCIACCFWHLLNTSDKEILRLSIQKEIKELRDRSLHEQEAFPDLLLQKVRLALAMRFG